MERGAVVIFLGQEPFLLRHLRKIWANQITHVYTQPKEWSYAALFLSVLFRRLDQSNTEHRDADLCYVFLLHIFTLSERQRTDVT